MGLIKIIPQSGGTPENPGVTQLIDAGTGILSVASGVVTLGAGTLTYTATGPATLPSDQEIFDLWAPVVGAANGAAGPASVAPIVSASNGKTLYPALA